MENIRAGLILSFVTLTTLLMVDWYTENILIAGLFALMAQLMAASVIWKMDFGTWNIFE